MATIKTNDNRNFDIYMNADMFVVPNKAAKIVPELVDLEKKTTDAIAANGMEFDLYNDKFVQVWMVSTDEESKCDNLQDHSISFNYNNLEIFISYVCGHILLKALKEVKENDTIDMVFPMQGWGISVYDTTGGENIRDWKHVDYEEDVKVNLHLHLTAKQQGYRYQRFGNFEDVVSYVE